MVERLSLPRSCELSGNIKSDVGNCGGACVELDFKIAMTKIVKISMIGAKEAIISPEEADLFRKRRLIFDSAR